MLERRGIPLYFSPLSLYIYIHISPPRMRENLGAQETQLTWFSPILDQRIVRVGGSQGELVGVPQVEVVDADDEGLEALAVLESLGQGLDEGRLADTLHAVQADDEGLRRVGGTVELEALEDEGDADGRLIVDCPRLQGDVWGGGHVC